MSERTDLVALALTARQAAYCPYSGYAVGSALQTESGSVFTGCNVENISFGATICAERSAVAKMVSAGERRVRRIAVATRDGGPPCGICLQVLAEFIADPSGTTVLLVRESGEVQEMAFSELAPHAFATEAVKRTDRL